ncbi:MAG: response regulator [Syntrophorhabdaceae bacterium]|nr:response regulator [Syntrophorhabdaceae bacterium]
MMRNKNIMVVEDEWVVADQICRDLEDFGYTVWKVASTGAEAISKVKAEKPDLILMDIVLEGKMDGIDAAERIISQFDVPVIYLTAYTNEVYIERARQTRPFGYLLKPFEKNELYTNIEMALHKHGADKEVKDYLDRLIKCFKGTIDAVSGAFELRGPYTIGHHRRVAQFAQAIAGEMGLTDFSVEGLSLAAYVYDVSFVDIPSDILQDSGRLTGLKLNAYHAYPQLSYNILKEVDFPWAVADIVLQHREHYDGSGFPKGTRGADILIEARILSVADAIEDLTSHRSFRNALTLKQALDEIEAHRGSRYDPDVVDVCLELFGGKGTTIES